MQALTAYAVDAPVVGGHSLGGMVALAYGIAHPTCPGVINTDGHGRGRPEQYVGYDETQVRQGWAAQDRRVARLTSGVLAVSLRGVLRLLRQPTVAPATAAPCACGRDKGSPWRSPTGKAAREISPSWAPIGRGPRSSPSTRSTC